MCFYKYYLINEIILDQFNRRIKVNGEQNILIKKIIFK